MKSGNRRISTRPCSAIEKLIRDYLRHRIRQDDTRDIAVTRLARMRVATRESRISRENMTEQIIWRDAVGLIQALVKFHPEPEGNVKR